MKEITFYEAHDGRSFRNANDFRNHERELDEVRELLADIPANPKGEGFIQLRVNTKQNLLNRLRQSKYNHPRLADDSNSPYHKAWLVWQCIDSLDRLYEQPYFAIRAGK